MNELLMVLLVALVCGTSAEVTYLMTQSRIVSRPRLRVQWWAEKRWADEHDVPFSEVVQEDEWCSMTAYLLSCSWCSGVYLAGAVTLVADLAVGLPWPWLVWGLAAYVSGRWGGEQDG